jgi:predicted transcriptional regulator of viral defense system
MEVNSLKKLGIFRSSQAKAVGVGAPRLAWLVKKGEVKKIASDTYHHASIETTDYVAACNIFGKESYVGGFTALSHYHLVETMVSHIWMVVEPSSKSNNPLYRLIRTKESKAVGIETHDWYKITSIERAILDAFFFEKKIGGIGTALSSVRVALTKRLTTYERLFALAKELGWQKRMLKHWEAISAYGIS